MSNTVAALKEFFSTPERPVKAKEMMEFWSSLSEEQKEYYKNASLA
jgi:hypothetical protein